MKLKKLVRLIDARALNITWSEECGSYWPRRSSPFDPTEEYEFHLVPCDSEMGGEELGAWRKWAARCCFGHSIRRAKSAWVSTRCVLCNSCARLIRLGQHPSVNQGSDGPLMTALRAELDHAHTP